MAHSLLKTSCFKEKGIQKHSSPNNHIIIFVLCLWNQNTRFYQYIILNLFKFKSYCKKEVFFLNAKLFL